MASKGCHDMVPAVTLEQLRIFVSVAERQHITRAADALNLTQSAVSAAIAALEERHDARLFNRVQLVGSPAYMRPRVSRSFIAISISSLPMFREGSRERSSALMARQALCLAALSRSTPGARRVAPEGARG